MKLRKLSSMILTAVVIVVIATAAQAITIDMVTVGNPGNAGELSGTGAGGWGPDRICGAVDYVYQIGKYEVTAGQYTAFLNAVGGVDTYALYNTDMSGTNYGSGITRTGGGIVGNPYTYAVASAFANRPVNYVSYVDGMRFANWLHNGQPAGGQNSGTTEDGAYFVNGATSDAASLAVSRKAAWKWAVTSEDEWYKAAYHKNDGATGNCWDYPTGRDTPAPGRDMAELTNPGNNANYYAPSWPIDPPYYTTLVGEFQLSDSPYGTFDQGGNVWEWNESLLYSSSRGWRGGAFNYPEGDLRASSCPGYHLADEWYGSGFRVVSVPEPGSLAMLAGLAVVGLVYWRRRHA